MVTIDPNHTVISNFDNRAIYTSITVPATGKVLGASTISDTERATLISQLAAAEAQLQALLHGF
jgi:hypothetical protein